MKAIEIHNLQKTYEGGFQALKGIDLNVEEGDFFALLGPNGAGKSTTIGIIASLVRKTGGSVAVFDCDMDEDRELAKSYLGLVPQEFNFAQFEVVLSIVLNQAGYYGIPRPVAHTRAEHYLKQLGLWDKRKGQARALSGGMKRKLMIARALLHEPRLLILDEPTAGVDIESRRAMWDFLRTANRAGTTIILTTHNLEEAETLCRNTAIIDQGVIIENTSMKHLISELNSETFVFDLKEPMTETFQADGYTVELLDNHTLEVEVSRQEGINRLFTELTRQGIEVSSMRNKANRLEETFLRMVNESGVNNS